MGAATTAWEGGGANGRATGTGGGTAGFATGTVGGPTGFATGTFVTGRATGGGGAAGGADTAGAGARSPNECPQLGHTSVLTPRIACGVNWCVQVGFGQGKEAGMSGRGLTHRTSVFQYVAEVVRLRTACPKSHDFGYDHPPLVG